MRTAKYRHIIVALLMMVFIGQSVAAVNISCSMMDAETPGMGQMVGMDHSAHTMQELADSSSKSDTSSVDCCGDALCSMSHCVGSSTFSVATSSQFDFYGTSVLNTRYSMSYLAPEALSLFRPPITH
jgi:hypothetical protein